MKFDEINGDVKLNFKKKIQYIFINSLKLFQFSFSKINNQHYKIKNYDYSLLENNTPTSNRYLQDHFIKNELYKYLPKQIDVLDIGCGKSEICNYLQLSGFSGNYTGVDLRNYYEESYGQLNFNKDFIQKNIHDIEFKKKFDLIISNSSLEHIKDDKLILEKCKNLMNDNGFQIHLVPSRFSLFLYLFHGYRQYSVKDIEERFGKNIKLFYLGGFFSFIYHLFFLTLTNIIIKKDMRKIFPKAYIFLLKKIIYLDRFLPFFYSAVIIIKKYEKK